MTIIITLTGIMSYLSLPKNKFPDIVIPTIYVTTIYPGTSPTDMENLVVKPIEKKISISESFITVIYILMPPSPQKIKIFGQ